MARAGSRTQMCRNGGHKPVVTFTLGKLKQEAKRRGLRLDLPEGVEKPFCHHCDCVGSHCDVLQDTTSIILVRRNGREALFHARHRHEPRVEVVSIHWRDFVHRVAYATGYEIQRDVDASHSDALTSNSLGSKKSRPRKRSRALIKRWKKTH